MNGFSSVLNDVESPGFFQMSKLATREQGRQTVLPLCTGTFQTQKAAVLECAQASSEIMALAIAKENKIDAICRACSF